MVGWRDIAFVPDERLSSEVGCAWEWLLGSPDWVPVICSRLGDFFLERTSGEIDWLSCSAGAVQLAAPSRQSFDDQCRGASENVSSWFGPNLIEQLHDAGKIAGDGQCYFFITLPVFAECKYEPANLAVVPVREVFVGLADTHFQLSSLPDGEQVKIKVVD